MHAPVLSITFVTAGPELSGTAMAVGGDGLNLFCESTTIRRWDRRLEDAERQTAQAHVQAITSIHP